jgi:hypothetical protein
VEHINTLCGQIAEFLTLKLVRDIVIIAAKISSSVAQTFQLWHI